MIMVVGQRALETMLLLAMPMLLVALLVGLLVGVFQVNQWVAAFTTLGVILSAAYALWLYRRVIFGPLNKADLVGMLDLNRREMALLAPLVILILLFGVYPQPLLEVMHASVDNLISQHTASIDAASRVVAVGR